MKWRTITVDGLKWYYHVGTDSLEARAAETNGSHWKLWGSLSEITKRSPETIERGRHKKTSDGMVTPRQIAGWIRDKVAFFRATHSRVHG